MIKLNIYETGLAAFPFDETKPYIEVTEEQYSKIVDGVLRYRNGELVDITEENAKKRRIEELKQMLESYDYIGTKIATGRATREEYATQIQQMTAWANEINELEEQL